MNISLSIERNRKQLARIVATLFAMIGLAEGETVERLSSPVYRAVLRVLRPAESAVRRLIVVAARGLTVKPPVKRSAAPPKGPVIPRKGRRRFATFQLFDPRQRFGSAFGHRRHRINLVRRPEPRIRVIDVGFDPRVPLFRRAAAVAPVPPPPPVPLMTLSMPRVSAAVLPPSSQRLKICRAKPGAMHAGKPSLLMRGVRSLPQRCAEAARRDIATNPFIRSTKF